MKEINISNVVKNYGFNNVLDGISLEILSKDRVAIVGSNGAGKTTLFRLIKGIEGFDSGNIAIRKGINIGLLEQIPPVYGELLVKDILELAFEDLNKLGEKLSKLEHSMSNNKDMEQKMKKYSRIQEEFIRKDGYQKDVDLAKICDMFKINSIYNQRFDTLSGGQKTTVHFAYLLLKKPDILLLDEPTNHLDVETVEWLEGYLRRYQGTVVISSHDRYFLDKVANKTILIERGKAITYHGNYSYFIRKQEADLEIDLRNYKNERRKVKAIEDAIKRYRDWGARADNPKFFKAAASLEKRLEKMDIMENPEKIKMKVPINFNSDKRSGNKVIELRKVSKVYDGKEVLKELDFSIDYKENVCLLGRNGAGKTTIINLILDKLKPDSGVVKLGANVKVGYLSQEIKFKNDDVTIYDEFRNHFVGDETEGRTALAKFYFEGDSVFKKLKSLSGGEKVRLILAELIQDDVNLLILDEPTNHIDIDTKEVLEESLLEFEGTILFVSHDRYFINKMASKVAHLNNGEIIYYLGNYDYYKEKSML